MSNPTANPDPLATITADELGRSLRGFAVNVLVREVAREVEFLTCVFAMTAHQASDDYALLSFTAHRDAPRQLVQVHADHTYHSHPYLGLMPEAPPRGLGVELQLYECDPDVCAARAIKHGYTVLQPPADKPHGLRECFILSPEGYCWVPSRARD